MMCPDHARYVECSIYLYQNRGLPAVTFPLICLNQSPPTPGQKFQTRLDAYHFLSFYASRLPPLSADGSLRGLDDGKSARAHGHGAQQRGPDALPEPPHALGPPGLGEAVPHVPVAHVGAEAVGLHLALDDVEGVAGEPEGLAREAAVEGDLVGGDGVAGDVVAAGVGVHHPLEGEEPHAVGLGLAEHGDGLAAVDAAQAEGAAAGLGAELAHAVQGAGVQARGAVGLGLQADAHVLDGAGYDGVGDAREGAGGEVLAVAQVPGARGGVGGLEVPLRVAEGAELDRDAGADADEGRQRALVEGEGALLRVDGPRGVEGRGVLRRRLQTHLDYVEGLAW